MLLQTVTSLIFTVVSFVSAPSGAVVAFIHPVFPVLNAYFYAVSAAILGQCCFYQLTFFTVTLLQNIKYTISNIQNQHFEPVTVKTKMPVSVTNCNMPFTNCNTTVTKLLQACNILKYNNLTDFVTASC